MELRKSDVTEYEKMKGEKPSKNHKLGISVDQVVIEAVMEYEPNKDPYRHYRQYICYEVYDKQHELVGKVREIGFYDESLIGYKLKVNEKERIVECEYTIKPYCNPYDYHLLHNWGYLVAHQEKTHQKKVSFDDILKALKQGNFLGGPNHCALVSMRKSDK